MQAITNRQQSALDELFSRYGSRLKSMIRKVVREEDEADDVLQDLMIHLWRDARRYSRNVGSPLVWIATLARRRAIDRIRRRQAYLRAKERYADRLQESLGPSSQPAADEASRSDLRGLLDGRLKHLPELQREVIQLAFFKGMSHREIAATTKAPLSTVKTRLDLGLQKLAQALTPLRGEF